MADQPKRPDGAAQASPSMEKKRREAVDRVAERNRKAHMEAKKVRQESDRIKASRRGPNDR